MKTRSFLVVVVSLLVGLILGVVAVFLYIKSRPAVVTSVTSGQAPIDFQLSKEFVDNVKTLVPGKAYNGKVIKKDDKGVVLDIWFYNSMNPVQSQAISVSIPFNSTTDKVVRPAMVKGVATSTPASYNDISMGDYMNVLIFSDHKEFGITSAK